MRSRELTSLSNGRSASAISIVRSKHGAWPPGNVPGGTLSAAASQREVSIKNGGLSVPARTTTGQLTEESSAALGR